jgi:hypothetical protein
MPDRFVAVLQAKEASINSISFVSIERDDHMGTEVPCVLSMRTGDWELMSRPDKLYLYVHAKAE